MLREVARELVLHARVLDGDGGGQDEWVAVPALPQAVDHRRHQAQHAAGALEPGERGPVRVEAVEDLGMDGEGGPDAPLVVRGAAFGRELHALRTVGVGERAGGHVALLERLRPRQRLEQPPPHDLEAFLGARGPPGRLDPRHHVAQPVEGLAPAQAPHLRIVRLAMGRAGAGGGVGGRQRDHQQAVLRHLHRLGERLGEGELGLEAARGQVAAVVELARVGHPLVDQHQARPMPFEQGA